MCVSVSVTVVMCVIGCECDRLIVMGCVIVVCCVMVMFVVTCGCMVFVWL